ncbi:MAG: glycosyltransferase 87 family protein [Hyphomicrobiaceae bacterium]
MAARLAVLWWVIAAGLAVAVILAIQASGAFAPGRPATGMPILAFAGGLLASGLVFLGVIPLLRRSERLDQQATRRLLALVIGVGLGLRVALLASEPILEVDFNRYLWDGGLTAHGLNPYSVAPGDVARLAYDDLRLELSKSATPVFERISYADLKTIYPPVAQAWFALAHLIAPWSLTAWRCVAIGADVVTLVLLLALLRDVGRSPLWVALYWWCPLVLKEVVNSAHMEAVLLPTLLASLVLTVRHRSLAATAMLVLAIGTKLWPVMLVPIVLRRLIGHPARLAAALAILAGGAVVIVLPVWLGGIDQSSGFVGFATHWATNSAHFPMLEGMVRWVLGAAATSVVPGGFVRLLSAAGVLAFALWLARRPHASAEEFIQRVFWVTSALLLLSPAQFPWYVLWVLPLATLTAGWGWHVAAAVMPLYYSAFHFQTTGTFWIYEAALVWVLWLPIWLVLAWDVWRMCRGSELGAQNGAMHNET